MSKDIVVKVIPRSSQSEIVEETDGYLKIKLKASPTQGKANAELIKLLAKKYQVSQSEIEIIKGLTSRDKLIRIYL
ncbi:MAG: DUF167 domain-containing protein [Patescibacteria group bacterium]|jgi:uncharacterized protein (TIGR00251 family)|nr:DUF167 domain-containing protein [Patescibacteria group bacterium]